MSRWRWRLLGDPLTLLVCCALLHVGAVLAVTEPWWAPNLTLVGLILGVARAPERWLGYSAAAALIAMAWAVRAPVLVAGAYLAAGWFIHWMSGRWDVPDLRVQGTLVAMLSGLAAFGPLWLQGLWSMPLAVLAAMHVLLTYAAFRLISWVVPAAEEAAVP
jgi:hypothetical protein